MDCFSRVFCVGSDGKGRRVSESSRDEVYVAWMTDEEERGSERPLQTAERDCVSGVQIERWQTAMRRLTGRADARCCLTRRTQSRGRP